MWSSGLNVGSVIAPVLMDLPTDATEYLTPLTMF